MSLPLPTHPSLPLWLRRSSLIGVLACVTALAGCGRDRDASLPERVAGHCVATSRFTGLTECTEYLGDDWTAQSVESDCVDTGGEAAVIDEPCPESTRLGSCVLNGGTEEVKRVHVLSDATNECAAQKRGCQLFGGGAWVPAALCGGANDEVVQEGGPVFIPPTLQCKDPLPGEPAGASADGKVCTWEMISGATEAGRKFQDYASCEVVLTQRPYYPVAPNTARLGMEDPRMTDPEYVTELSWVKSQIEATACVCCHASSITPMGASNWDIEAPGNFMDTFFDTGLAVGANYISSRELGAYPPEDNNGFERDTVGLPSTDPERMARFFREELAWRGKSAEDFAGRRYTAGPLGAQLEYVPGECESGEGVGRDGSLSWRGGGARYIYVLREGSENPGVPPNLDRPQGTLWRIDRDHTLNPVTADAVRYGQTPAGMTQVVPAPDAQAPALEPGKRYYLYILADIAIPITRCIFTY